MTKTVPITSLVAVAASAVAISGCGSSANAAASHPAATTAKAKSAAPAASAGTHGAAALKTAEVSVSGVKEQIVVTGAGRPVYLLTGDSVAHPTCTSKSCLNVWPAVTATAATSVGLHARVTVWHHGGLSQLTLNGHPLYEFIGDSGTARATGQGIHSFGGVWYVLSPSGQAITSTAKASSAGSSTGYGSSSGY
jgi:predicted lipoprotein with Yx(FWY)xxD motif